MLQYSLEVPRWGASNEYPQHMFLWLNKKNITSFRQKKVPYLELKLFPIAIATKDQASSLNIIKHKTWGKIHTLREIEFFWLLIHMQHKLS